MVSYLLKIKNRLIEKTMTCKKCKVKDVISSNFCRNCGAILPPNYINIFKTRYLYWVFRHLINKLRLKLQEKFDTLKKLF